jgi:hypothetical protein
MLCYTQDSVKDMPHYVCGMCLDNLPHTRHKNMGSVHCAQVDLLSYACDTMLIVPITHKMML